MPAYSFVYTRRRLRGRHPLCGIGVTSLIDLTLRPVEAKARTADSRPPPGPLTSTSIDLMPTSLAEWPTLRPAT